MIEFVKFYSTGSNLVTTFFTKEQEVTKGQQEHMFTDAQDALSKSTTKVFTFWDNEPMGVGLVQD